MLNPRTILRRLGILAATTATVALAVGMVSGLSGAISARATGIEVPTAAPPVPVSVTPLARVEGFTAIRRFTGQVEARESTTLAFERGGTLAEIRVDEGQEVAGDAVVARLDTRALDAEAVALRAQRTALEAQAELARLTTERQAELETRGFAATQRLDEARLGLAELQARIAETDARLLAIDIELDKSVLRAPFTGRVGTRLVDTGAAVSAGTPLLELLEESAPEVRVGLPPHLAATLALGESLEVDISGRRYTTTLTQLRPDLDPVTRTQTAILTLMEGETPLYGQIATLLLPEEVAAAGAWVPTAALRPGLKGLWTVLVAVDGPDGAVVAQEAVELLYTDEARALVRGTFVDGAQLINGGTHRVTPGQRISTRES
ncbi:MAG: efflux RND transporter periplasmic adaptor subunit [Pseudomonadota bacterium]